MNLRKTFRTGFMLLLAVCMIVCMMPTAAMATEDEDELHVQFNKDGTISWDEVPEAAKYYISLRLYPDSTGLYGEQYSTTNSFDMKAYMEKYKKESGQYYLMVAARDKSGATLKNSFVEYSYKSALPKLSTPENLRWFGNEAQWDKVEGATGYEVYVFNAETGQSKGSYTVKYSSSAFDQTRAENPCYQFDGHLQSDKNYYFTVTAFADGYIDSETASSNPQKDIAEALFTVRAIETVMESESDRLNINLDKNGMLTWDKKGETYRIELSDYSNGVETQGKIKVSENSYDLKAFMEKYKKPSRTYYLDISTTDNENNPVYEQILFYYASAQKQLSTPKNLRWYGNEAQWDKVEDAAGYIVKVYTDKGSLKKTTTKKYLSDKYAQTLAQNPCCQFDGDLQPDKNYYFTVTAFADNYRDSDTAKSPLQHEIVSIEDVLLSGNLSEGSMLTGNVLSTSGDAEILSCTWYENGTGVSHGAQVTKGNSYKACICLEADEYCKFTANTTATVFGQTVKAEEVSDDGQYAWFTTEAISIVNECNHADRKYQHSDTKHWVVCTDCGAKLSEEEHTFVKSDLGSSIKYSCTQCGFEKTGKKAETRTGLYYISLDLGTSFVGDTPSNTAELNYATIDSTNNDKYFDFATVNSVTYSTSESTFKNEKTEVTVVLKANENYYFKKSTIASAGMQYVRESCTASEDGTALTVVFSFTPYTPADVTLTLPEFTPGKTYKDIVKETKFTVNGTEIKNYSVSIKEEGKEAVLSNVSNGEPTETYLSTVVKPETKYTIDASVQLGKYYGKSITVTNPQAGTVTDYFAGETFAYVDASFTTPAEVDDKTINSVNLKVEAPTCGKAPVNTATGGTAYTVDNVSWSGTLADGKFTCNQVYGVEITLSKTGDYNFGETVQASVNGYPAKVSKSGDTIVVGYTFDKIEHIYKLKNNSEYHWYECARCGEIKDKEKHTVADGICSECGYAALNTYADTPDKDSTFNDVSKTDYYYDAVLWALDKGVTTGTSETTFSPAESCTRGQVVTFLWRAAGQPKPASTNNPFDDIEATDYYYNAILWAVEKGITNGTSATEFSPSKECSNAHIMTFIWRAMGKPDNSGSNVWYQDAYNWASTNGLLTGTYSGDFNVEGDCPRANVVEYLYRYYK